jgi:hypothetical protein
MSLRGCTLGLVLMLLGARTPSVAAEETSAEPSKWAFEVLPYAWLPGNFGALTVAGRTAIIDVTVKDLVDLATDGDALAAGGYFSVAYDRWSAFLDAYGGYANLNTTQKIPTRFCTLCIAAKAKLTPVIVDVAVGYRLGQWSIPKCVRPVTLGVYAGTRFMHIGSELKGSAGVVGGFQVSPNVEDAFNWADPMIGVRFEVPVYDRVTVAFRSDIGGFGVSSQLIWGIEGGMRYWLTWSPFSSHTWLDAGYRSITFDRDFGQRGNIDLAFRGPYVGLGFAF